MNYITEGRDGSINLQATLSSSTAAGLGREPPMLPHHPITCSGELRFEADGRFCCDHTSAPPGDVRTQACIDHSMAVLLIELSHQL